MRTGRNSFCDGFVCGDNLTIGDKGCVWSLREVMK